MQKLIKKGKVMSRNLKIKALEDAYTIEGFHGCLTGDCHHKKQKECFDHFFRDGILAGIALRNEELLAMEFDIDIAEIQSTEQCGSWLNSNGIAFVDGALWQHEQMLKAIKGE